MAQNVCVRRCCCRAPYVRSSQIAAVERQLVKSQFKQPVFLRLLIHTVGIHADVLKNKIFAKCKLSSGKLK